MHEKDAELSKYRYNLAVETLETAKLNFDNMKFRDSINRSYYAVFYAIRAVIALDSVDFKGHKQVVNYFNKEYIATERFPKELGKRIGRLKTKREASDYDDFFIASKEETQEQIETAEYALPLIKAYLENLKVIS